MNFMVYNVEISSCHGHGFGSTQAASKHPRWFSRHFLALSRTRKLAAFYWISVTLFGTLWFLAGFIRCLWIALALVG